MYGTMPQISSAASSLATKSFSGERLNFSPRDPKRLDRRYKAKHRASFVSRQFAVVERPQFFFCGLTCFTCPGALSLWLRCGGDTLTLLVAHFVVRMPAHPLYAGKA